MRRLGQHLVLTVLPTIGIVLAASVIPPSARAASITFQISHSLLFAPNGGTATFDGTVTNNTGANLDASDFFFNFFGFDALSVTPVQDLGVASDFLIPNGTTSSVVALFDVMLGSVPAGSSFPIQVQLEDANLDLSTIQTVTVSAPSSGAVPEPATLLLLFIGMLTLFVIRSRSRNGIPRSSFRSICLLLCLGATVLHPRSAGAQSAPAFSSNTPESGVVGSTFVVVIPLENSGGTADNVTVTSATFGTVPLTAPSLLMPLGSWPAASPKQLVLQFSSTGLTLGSRHLLTVRGTYESGSANLGFAVNRIIQVTTPDSSMLNDIHRWVTLDAIREESESVFALGEPASARAMLSFLQSRPEFAESGISPDSTSVWATFADGLRIVISFSSFSVPDLLPGATVAAPALSQTAPRPAEDLPRGESAETQIAGSARLSAGAANGGELPASSTFRFLTTFPNLADTALLPELTSWFSVQGYQPVSGATASVAGLKAMNGSKDGIFMIRTHGAILGSGTQGDPSFFALWTSDLATINSPQSDRDDANAAPARLAFFNAQIQKGVFELHWAITPGFVSTYWKPGTFSANSLVYIDACKSDADSAWKTAIMAAGASVYAGWSANTGDPFAAKTARLAFDRLLGANRYCPETSPNVPTPCAAAQAAPPIFAQRPFNYAAVSNTEYFSHELGAYTDVSSSFFGLLLNFTPPAPGLSFGLLAPSISNMTVDELKGDQGQLTINGTFGRDPRTGGSADSGMVTIGGPNSLAKIESWSPSAIVVDLTLSGEGSAGDVQVTVRDHKSNVARLTEWRGKQFNYTIQGNGSLQISSVFDLHLRADIRKWRKSIHLPPGEPSGVVIGAQDSAGTFSASGSGSAVGGKYQWSGSGNFVAVTPKTPPTGLNVLVAGGPIDDSTHMTFGVSTVSEALAKAATCTFLAPRTPPDISSLPVDGPSNLGPLIGLASTWYFHFELDSEKADILRHGPVTLPGVPPVSSYFCMDDTQTAKYSFQWGPVPATDQTAPDPGSAR